MIIPNKELVLEHEFCKRCGRRLKKPEARQLGYGAVCYRKVQVSYGRKLFDTSLPTERNTIHDNPDSP